METMTHAASRFFVDLCLGRTVVFVGFKEAGNSSSSQEEICKSLDIARESIASSMKEDQNIAPELTHFSTSVSCALEHASFRDTEVHEQGASQRSQASSLTSSSASHIPPVNQKEQFTSPKMASSFVTVSRKQESTSPSLAASPSYIRSLKHSEKHASGVPSTKSESASQGDVPFRNKLCDKAATFIEELSSIFREAAKTRGRSPDGDSSPDSGYLCMHLVFNLIKSS